MELIVSLVILVVSVGCFVAQLIFGTAITGTGNTIDRGERTGRYWFVIFAEGLVLIVAILSFLSFQLGVFV